ncbi:hypothetical protein ACEZCY_04910 [Streptacidiphilus sp. N1-12]|uniref:Uncharacterized protein n=2 Tax=Streptacidiphilus alkalitolerans TaxID=3342712 RepID=A0ABV6W940_9ACTN
MNILGRELNSALPQEMITGICSQVATNAPMTANHERLRAGRALDWLARSWVPHWSLLIPDVGEQVASSLVGLPPVHDLQTAEAAGNLIGTLSGSADNAERFVAANYKDDNFYERTAVKVARQASSKAIVASAGAAVADAAASVLLDEYLAAQIDVALEGVTALTLTCSLDSVWPYIVNWANGPGDFDAKQISIGNLAPYAAEKALDPTIEALQQEVCGLYVELCRLA